MNRIILVIVATCLFLACKEDSETTCIEIPDEDCVCAYDYAPVCGCNGTTYSNVCAAQCNGVIGYTEGECSN